MVWVTINSALIGLLLATICWTVIDDQRYPGLRLNLALGFVFFAIAGCFNVARISGYEDATITFTYNALNITATYNICRAATILADRKFPVRTIALSVVIYTAYSLLATDLGEAQFQGRALVASLVLAPWYVWFYSAFRSLRRGGQAYVVAELGIAAGVIVHLARIAAILLLPEEQRFATSMALWDLAWNMLAIGVTICALGAQASSIIGDLGRRTMELVQANSALSDSNQHRSRFLANMSHELRTPLTAILGFSDLARSLPAKTLEDYERKIGYFEPIDIAGQRLLDLINDLFDLSRIEAGQLVIEPTEFDAAAVIHDQIAVSSLDLARKEIALETEVEPGFQVLSDRPSFAKIVRNLVTNAVKYNRPQGRVSVALSFEGPDLHLVVSDTGVGMSPEEVDLAFTPYYRAPGVVTGAEEGTGLGLVILDQLVKLQGGRVQVDSEKSVGTTFRVILPGALPTSPAKAGGLANRGPAEVAPAATA